MRKLSMGYFVCFTRGYVQAKMQMSKIDSSLSEVNDTTIYNITHKLKKEKKRRKEKHFCL